MQKYFAATCRECVLSWNSMNTDEEGEVIDGCITIRIRMEEDEVEIIVKDNGCRDVSGQTR